MKYILLIMMMMLYACSENFGTVRRKKDNFLKSEWFTVTTEHPDSGSEELPNIPQGTLEIALMKEVKNAQTVSQTANFRIFTKKGDDPVQSRLFLITSAAQQELKISNSSATVQIDTFSNSLPQKKTTPLPGQSGSQGMLQKNITTLTLAEPEQVIRQLAATPNARIRAYHGTKPLMFKILPEDCEALKRFLENKADEEEN